MNFGKIYGLWLHLSRQFTKACKLAQSHKGKSKTIVLLNKNHSALFGILLIVVFSNYQGLLISGCLKSFPFGPGISPSLIDKNQWDVVVYCEEIGLLGHYGKCPIYDPASFTSPIIPPYHDIGLKYWPILWISSFMVHQKYDITTALQYSIEDNPKALWWQYHKAFKPPSKLG